MNKMYFSLISLLMLTIFACGGDSNSSDSIGSSSNVEFIKIEDDGSKYSIEDVTAIGFKKGKTVKNDDLMDGMTGAYWGFWKVPYKDWSGKDMIDYELRFFDSHSDAVSMGEKSADLRTGDNAQIRKKSTNDPNALHPIGADWPELLKEARECQGDGGHHTGACIIPKYADYKILNNLIILGQGADEEESHMNIQLMVDALKGEIIE